MYGAPGPHILAYNVCLCKDYTKLIHSLHSACSKLIQNKAYIKLLQSLHKAYIKLALVVSIQRLYIMFI